MKVKVLRDFRDKESKEIHKKDAEIIISKERFKEINSTEHGKLVEEIKEDKK